MKIYLAGKWEERDILLCYAKLLELAGHTITWPWFTPHIEIGLSHSDIAERDTQGIRDADMCIFIFERDLPYNGAMTELGMAIALEKEIIVVGSGGGTNLFLKHPYVEHVDTFIDTFPGAWL